MGSGPIGDDDRYHRESGPQRQHGPFWEARRVLKIAEWASEPVYGDTLGLHPLRGRCPKTNMFGTNLVLAYVYCVMHIKMLIMMR